MCLGYYPFGLKHKGYNNIIVGRNHKYGFNGKEEQDELGINWMDYGARNYDASLGRWMSPDQLSEEFTSWSPYNSMMDNPINFIDPDGRSAVWVPKVNEDGSTSYIAEVGDSAETLSSQYGISQDQAEEITDTSGDEEIDEGTEISGETVQEVTGSDVLKLDLTSKEGRQDQKRLTQYLFARDYCSECSQDSQFKASDFFTNRYAASIGPAGAGSIDGYGIIEIDGVNVEVYFDFRLSTISDYKNPTRDVTTGVRVIGNPQRPTGSFGKNSQVFLFGVFSPTGGQISQSKIITGSSNAIRLENYFFKK
ncbi:RHS repeat-associated core domain-containing protein [Sungkyunkwania multivorans]|uniref:RHS repeat-associated core domain-containing protein n=1 Tax=Sungkyunkwania multivorans TaxID=1173618 RepID=A0ABW3D1N5_9FLAO